MRIYLRIVQVRIAEESRRVGGIGATKLRGDSAICCASVVEVFVAELNLGGVVRQQCECWIETVTLEVHEIAIRIAVFVHGVESPRDGRRDRIPYIDGHSFVIELAPLQRQFPDWSAVGLLEHAVNYAATATTPKDHGIGAFEHLDAANVVEITEILHVVTDAVDEEIGVRALSADDDIVAIAFPLMR